MSEEKIMLHAYEVFYLDRSCKTKYVRGEIVEKDGTFYVNGKPDPNIEHISRIPWIDKQYRKPIPKSIRSDVYAMFDGRCAYCGKPLTSKQMRVDHVIPVYDGGPNDISNFMPSCQDCNNIKGAADIENLRETVSHFIETIKKDIRYRMLLAYGLIQETPHEIEFLYEKEKRK